MAESLGLVVEQGRQGDVPLMVRAAGRALAGLGRHAEAVRLFALGSRAVAVKASLPPDDPSLLRAAVERCREVLGEQRFAEAWEQGLRLTPDEAVALANACAGAEAETAAEAARKAGRT